MYYDNGSYMQDLNYYNQNPVQNFGYNPYMMNNFQNQQFPIGMGMQNQQNLKSMYPATYRVICPVVSQVVANNNTQYITEDSLNNMVDKVYNIVQGDINLSENLNETSTEATQVASNTRNSSSNSSTNSTNNSNCGKNTQNALLRDLIRIMILNEIISRRQNQAMMMQNFNMNQQMF